MKGIKVQALTNKGKEVLKGQSSKKMNVIQRATFKRMFLKEYNEEKGIFKLILKNTPLTAMLKYSDIKNKMMEEFKVDGCEEKDFRFSEL